MRVQPLLRIRACTSYEVEYSPRQVQPSNLQHLSRVQRCSPLLSRTQRLIDTHPPPQTPSSSLLIILFIFAPYWTAYLKLFSTWTVMGDESDVLRYQIRQLLCTQCEYRSSIHYIWDCCLIVVHCMRIHSLPVAMLLFPKPYFSPHNWKKQF